MVRPGGGTPILSQTASTWRWPLSLSLDPCGACLGSSGTPYASIANLTDSRTYRLLLPRPVPFQVLDAFRVGERAGAERVRQGWQAPHRDDRAASEHAGFR